MNKTIYEYPIDTKERIAECSSCCRKFAPTVKYVSLVGNTETSITSYAACPKCGHRSEWFEKQTRSLTNEENEAYVSTDQSELLVVKENLEKRGYNIKSSELIMSPNSLKSVDIENADKVFNLMEIIDNHDDVNQVYSNFSLNEVN